MNAMNLKTPAGEELVLLPRAEYEALIARLEELEEDAADAEAARAATAELAASGNAGRREISPSETLAYHLRHLRKAAGKTQADLAGATDLAQGYVSDLESGRRKPSREAFDKIMIALGVPEGDVTTLRKAYGFA